MGFSNPHQKNSCRNFIHFLLWCCGFYNDPTPLAPVPQNFSYPNRNNPIDTSAPYVTWINHSSYFIDLNGKRFLLDPVWSERCSPFGFLGPKRHVPPPCVLEDLKKIDYVILSHNHYDHLDKKTLRKLHQLYPEITWIVPLKLKKWLLEALPSIEKGGVIELDWWEEFQTGDFTFTAVPAQHFSGRGIFDQNQSLWMGCVVESASTHKCFYFAGDTGYNPYDFHQIGERFKKIDLSLLPVGVYLPRRFMQAVHINPEEAVKIHEEVHSKLSIGGHWGTFKLSSDCLVRPPYDLYCALEKRGHSWEEFRILRPGQSVNW